MSAKSILMTGCSSGIGYHCAHIMKRRGWQVLATVRKESDRARLEGEGLSALILDYANPTSVQACADAALAATDGHLFALFNNGAYGQTGAVEDLSVDVLRAQFEANVFGWHDLTTRLIPTMRSQNRGRIVQCSSVLGFITMKYRGAYAASKYAIEALSDSLAMELEGTDIHVSLIEPGPITSRFVEHTITHFEANINWQNSVHRADYEKRMARMKRGGANKFKLGPEAVAKRLIHAVEHPRPRPRYYVTTPTYVMGTLRRLMTHRALRRFLTDQSNKEVSGS